MRAVVLHREIGLSLRQRQRAARDTLSEPGQPRLVAVADGHASHHARVSTLCPQLGIVRQTAVLHVAASLAYRQPFPAPPGTEFRLS